MGFQVFTDFNDVRTLTDKGGRNKVNALFATEDQVLLVFFGQRRQSDRHARQVNAFVLAKVAVVQHFTNNFVAFDSGDFHTDQTIVNQYGVADAQVAGETFIGHRNDFVITDNGFVGGEGKGLARFQRNVVAAFQLNGTDFRTFGIQKDCRFLTGFTHHIAQVLDALTVFRVVTVREVQTHNVHASVQHFSQHLFGFGFRTDGANNFGLFHDSLIFKL